MKPERLILRPYLTMSGYDFLQHIFSNDADAMSAIKNLDLLLDYLTCKYKRSDIGVDGKTLDITVSIDDGEALFCNDKTNYKYYLFPIMRSEAYRRLNKLQECLVDNEKILKLSLDIDMVYNIINHEYLTHDMVSITINDTSIPKYKKILIYTARKVWKRIRYKFQSIYPMYYPMYDFHKPVYNLSKYRLNPDIKFYSQTVEYFLINRYNENKTKNENSRKQL
ncbi:MAG: hypothetical protein ACOH2V_12240 [Candidatus Saccharimonadaceae bacterium]